MMEFQQLEQSTPAVPAELDYKLSAIKRQYGIFALFVVVTFFGIALTCSVVSQQLTFVFGVGVKQIDYIFLLLFLCLVAINCLYLITLRVQYKLAQATEDYSKSTTATGKSETVFGVNHDHTG